MTVEGTQDDRPKPTGEQLMLEMLENIVLMNKHLHEGAKRTEVVVSLLDELVDWFNVMDKTFEILHEQRGKKFNVADIAQAWCEAAEEILPEEEEDGSGDVLAGETG